MRLIMSERPYVENGIAEMERSKLPDYLKLKFGTVPEAAAAFGGWRLS